MAFTNAWLSTSNFESAEYTEIENGKSYRLNEDEHCAAPMEMQIPATTIEEVSLTRPGGIDCRLGRRSGTREGILPTSVVGLRRELLPSRRRAAMCRGDLDPQQPREELHADGTVGLLLSFYYDFCPSVRIVPSPVGRSGTESEHEGHGT